MLKVTIKAYAVKHKLSIFNVMKMVKSGKLKSDIVEENGREVTYILLDEATEKAVKEQIIPINQKAEVLLREEVKMLREELEYVKEEITKLKKRL